MRSRIASIATVLLLLGATGGAIALGSSTSGGPAHSAAVGQYKRGKGCGKPGQHSRGNECKPKKKAKKHKKPKHHGPVHHPTWHCHQVGRTLQVTCRYY